LGEAVVRIKGLGKSFGGENPLTVIENLDLEVSKGEFLTVVGASGCGKSTLLNLIAGLDAPNSGTIEAHGKVALMFQDATLLPWLTAVQNIKLALKLQGLKEPQLTTRAKELLEVVRLGPAMKKRPHELSGGMKQRVALARCLAQDASIVLMDEPLGALDAMTRDLLHDEIEGLAKDQGLTVIFVTHNMREAVRLGDRVILMGSNPGRIVHEEPVTLEHPRLIDSTDVANRAAKLTRLLKSEQASGTLSGADS
jgi:NitT/TauT family transport system ATP-binding protein